jgi:MFS family permease
VVQGLGAAAALPAALAMIGSLFEPGRERTRALSLLAAMASVGVMTGLLLGGLVTELLGWRWVFLVMAPPPPRPPPSHPGRSPSPAPRSPPPGRTSRAPRSSARP